MQPHNVDAPEAPLWEPDWEMLDADRIRRDQEIPWLTKEIEEATAEALISADQVRLAEFRGRIEALKYIRDFPGQQVARIQEEARLEEARREEAENAAKRARSRFGWLTRIRGDRPDRVRG